MKTKKISIILTFILFLHSLSTLSPTPFRFISAMTNDRDPPTLKSSSQSYIFINDTNPNYNWSKTEKENSWCSGNGTYENPYIIEDISINGGYQHSTIKIINSMKYFIIRNCSLDNGYHFDCFNLEIKNVSNGLINNNSFSNAVIEISVQDASNLTFSTNSFDGMGAQFEIGSLSNVNASNFMNNTFKNYEIGIEIGDSNRIMITNNSFTDTTNEMGIPPLTLSSCSNSSLLNNTFSNNPLSLKIIDSNQISIISNDFLVSKERGIFLSNSDWNNISQNHIYDVDLNEGLYALFSHNNTISHNSFYYCDSGYGLSLTSSDDNLLFGNNFSFNLANAFDNGLNYWNHSKSGNFWDDYTGIDADDDGIGDSPYSISGGGNKDYLPIWNDGNDTLSDFILSSNADTLDSDGKFLLSWTQSAHAEEYDIYKSNNTITEINNDVSLVAENIETLSFNENNLDDGTFYYIVFAFNRYGANKSSNNIQVSIGHYPQIFTLTSNADEPDSDGVFTLDWTLSSYADNYSIYFSHSPISEINQTLTYVTNTEVTYLQLDMENGCYYFIILAINEYSNYSSNNVKITIDKYPHSFELTSDSERPDLDGIFNLIWTESKNADNYSIYMYHNFIIDINTSLTLIKSYHLSRFIKIDVSEEGTYYFIIVSHNRFGNNHSNCLKIVVDYWQEPDQDSSDDELPKTPPKLNIWLILIIATIIISTIVGIMILLYLKKKRWISFQS